MKHIVRLVSVVTLLATAGCIFPGHRGGGDYGHHQEYRGHDDDHGRGENRGYPESRGYPGPAVDVRIHG